MKGCLIAGLVLLGCVLVAGVGALRVYQHVTDEFPDYAREDAVYARYGGLIGEVASAIDESQSFYDLAAKLEQLDEPDLIYLTLEKSTDEPFEDDMVEIIEQVEVSSRWQTLIGSTGHGEINDVPVVVIALPVNKHAIENCFIYLRQSQIEAVLTE